MANNVLFLVGQTQTRKLSNDVLTKTVLLDFSLNNTGSGDVVLFATPAKGDVVLHVSARVLTAGTASSTFTVGDFLAASPYTAVTATGWISNAIAGDALGGGLSRPADTYPALGGKVYDGATSLGMTMSAHAQTALKVEVTIVFAIMKNYSES
jgi:hypothetical protein